VRVLFFITHAGYARNFEWTLRLLAERGHRVDVALDQAEKANLRDHARLLRSLEEEYDGLSSTMTPPRRPDGWEAVGVALRTWLDYLRYLEPEFADAPQLRERARRRLPQALATFADRYLSRPAPRGAMRGLLNLADAGVPVRDEVRRFIAQRKPDVVVVTPLVELNSPQHEYVRCAHELGIPTVMPVASWDNLTVKGVVHELPQLVCAWNEEQASELRALHHVPADRIAITGAVAYDHWFGWQPRRSREEFCQLVGLDPARPYVLHAGSSPFIAPSESDVLADWIAALQAERHPGLDGLQVLVRPHPQNPQSGATGALARLDDVAVYPPHGANPVDESSRADYFDSIWHAAAVLGINTSAFVESAIIGRPVHALLAPEYGGTQLGTLHFRHLIVENGGIVHTAATPQALAENLATSLAGGGERNDAFVEQFVRPLGRERRATPELVDRIEEAAARAVVPESHARVARVIGRPLALPARWYLRRRFAPGAHAERVVRREIDTLRRHVEDLLDTDGPILAGPYLGEVGFELLYWIPLLRWAATEYPELRDRLAVCSRGGTRSWYAGLASRYVDAYGLLDAEELVLPRSKQRSITGLDREVAAAARARLGIDGTGLLHPSLMYNAYYRTIKADPAAFANAVQRDGEGATGLAARYERLPLPSLGALADVLPDEFFAVRFYSSSAFPKSAENAAVAERAIAILGEQAPVVLLDNGLELDDHRDFKRPEPNLVRLSGLMDAATNLELQTIAIARARAFVGTHGGLAYLAPQFGGTSIAFESDDSGARPWHLELAQRAFPTLSVLRSDHMAKLEPLGRLTTAPTERRQSGVPYSTKARMADGRTRTKERGRS
jgi:hypothetical protein